MTKKAARKPAKKRRVKRDVFVAGDSFSISSRRIKVKPRQPDVPRQPDIEQVEVTVSKAALGVGCRLYGVGAEPPVDVVGLLRQSRAANAAFHAIDRTKVTGKADLMKAKALEARDLRQQAHDADPTHSDLEWANDKAPHLEIMAFYDRYIRGH